MNNAKKRNQQLLIMEIQPHVLRIERKTITSLVKDFTKWLPTSISEYQDVHDWMIAREWVGFLLREAEQKVAELKDMEERFSILTNRYSRGTSTEEKQNYLLTFSEELGASKWERYLDARALKRYMDYDALTDRFHGYRRTVERTMAFCLTRAGLLAEYAILNKPEEQQALWARMELERRCRPFWEYRGNGHLRKEAFAAFARAYRALPESAYQNAVSDSMVHVLYRAALEKREIIWFHIEAIELLADISHDSFEQVLVRWFEDAHGSNDDEAIFIRARAIQAWSRILEAYPLLENRGKLLANDPSPFVRQAFARSVVSGSKPFAKTWLQHLLNHDDNKKVRAQAFVVLVDALPKLGPEEVVQLWEKAFHQDQDQFVLKTAMKIAVDLATYFYQHTLSKLVPRFNAALEKIDWELSVSLSRMKAQTSEKLWLLSDARLVDAAFDLRNRIERTAPGKTVPYPKSMQQLDLNQQGRILSILAQSDFGLDLEQNIFGKRVRRGSSFGFRWWRLFHELKNPDPAKRQGVSHSIGRVSKSLFRAPSAILAELAEAKVPGEPLFMDDEGGWRPYLPLVEDGLSLLDFNLWGKPVRFYTSEGITVMYPPRNLLRRIYAFFVLSTRFTEFVRLRNWSANASHSEDAYIKALEKLGFRIQIDPLEPHHLVDPKVKRFFPTAIPLLPPGTVHKIKDYLSTVYGNTLLELSAFLAAAIGYFFAHHSWANLRIRFARMQVPLVIGGWGTRGKSGTERLKAALFNALGYSVYSKTTGCEAMFVYSMPYENLYEMALFRPYDKATIWEQGDVIRMAKAMGTEVFLWECMGLNPNYVRILQRQWMKDDYCTITNTFPDHEDIQGPAGYNIPIVMTEFIPKNSILLTTEESMYPFLAAATQRLNTKILPYGWLEAGLLTDDALKRFPYEEHPYNIALVIGLGEQLGIPPDFSLKEMADRVVPDLGVLKTFAPAKIDTRRFIFSNGMSANERLGCLTNWTRLGFDKSTPQTHPDVFISTVVNNRADRISRSQMFADIMVRDISVDFFVLIGNNLEGMNGYLEESWDSFAASLGIFSSKESPLDRFNSLARWLRVPTTEAMVTTRLEIMAKALIEDGNLPDGLSNHWQKPEQVTAMLTDVVEKPEKLSQFQHFLETYLKQYQEYVAIQQKLTTNASPAMESDILKTAHAWYKSKLVYIDDYYASGDKVIHRVVQETPFGFTNRVMGLQNIKGTGLDFAYRFLAWDQCYLAGQKLLSDEEELFAEGLDTLMTFRDYGVLSDEYMANTLETAKHAMIAQKAKFQAQLVVIETRYRSAISKVQADMNKVVEGRFWLARFFDFIEDFFDVGDAVKRRKKCNTIYKDLAANRISRARASYELKIINKRQKGGWLWNQVNAFFRRGKGGDADET